MGITDGLSDAWNNKYVRAAFPAIIATDAGIDAGKKLANSADGSLGSTEALDQATQNINAQVALANASAQKSQAAASGVFTDVNAAKSNAIMAAQGAASARAAAAANPNDPMLQAQAQMANAALEDAKNKYFQAQGPVQDQVNLGPAAQAGYAPTVQAQAAQAALAQAANLGPAAQAGYAPTVSAQQVQAERVQQQAAIQAQQVQAERVQQQAAIQAQQVQAERIQAARAAGGPAANAQMASVTPVGSMAQAQNTYLASPAFAQAAKIDQDPQAQFRANQTDLVSGLQGAINGNDPSVAAIMLRQATDRNVASQYALAQAANGMNSGAATRQAMINAAEANQQGIGQQALLRAQEIATARGQLGGVLDSARGADIGLASNQAGLQQQTNLANQGAINTTNLQQGAMNQQVALANQGATNQGILTQAQIAAAAELQNAGAMTDVSKFNSGQAQALNLANAGFQQDASKVNASNALSAAQGNQSANLAASTTNATLAQQVALANAANSLAAQTTNAGNNLSASTTNATLAQQVALANARNSLDASTTNANNNLSAGTTNASLAQGVNLANMQAYNQQAQTQAQLQNAVNLANANNQTGVSQTNANNYTSASQSNAQLANAVNLANASQQNSMAQAQGQLTQQTNAQNQSAAQKQQDMIQQQQQNYAQNALTASGQAMAGTASAANSAASALNAKNQQNAALMNLGTTGLATYMTSDRNAKTDVRNSAAEIAEFTRSIKPQSWRYKDPDMPGAAPGERFGVMAQDLEKSKVGRSLVSEGPNGYKQIDTNQAVGAILATLSQMNRRIDRAEARR